MGKQQPVRLRFNEAKAAQVAARLLYLAGGRMNYMKLIKLMYLVDRGALAEWGRPVSTDRFVSMPHGPVLSAVLDRINEGPDPGEPSPWNLLISPPSGYEVSLRVGGEPPDEELSRGELDVIERVHAQYGSLEKWALVDFLHTLDEWQDPEGSSIPFGYGDVLAAVGRSRHEISELENEMRSAEYAGRYAV